MLSVKSLSLILVALYGSLLLGSQVFAQDSVAKVTASTDVEATMKSMALAYQQAMVATEPSAMQSKVTKLKQLVASVQLVRFEPKRQSILQQGLTEVQAQLDLVNASLTEGDMTTAKQQLEKVDALKKQYHKKRSPSIWELLFGSD
ncbi:cytochrome b562 [uncultured Paraglaciecola sp.]|uniref:cytochrome b562 n=1 Tax=uncultured Paraglaciecola sp. TaxID=1765024 RepID=UPI00259831EB|nr:cytochrome b562 [uncultured Paraglaciecola sp.]